MQSFNPSASSASKWKVSFLADKLAAEHAKNKCVPFVALTETWLKSYIDDAQIDIPGYNVFRSDRNARVGGGVLLYSHEKLPITQVETYDDKICQALICRCELTKSIICVLYRPPDCPVLSFRSCLDFLDSYISDELDSYQLSIFGDFNLPLVNWPTHVVSSGGSVSSMECAALLLDFMAEHLSTQYITQPTRLENVLDLYITNSEELVTHISTSGSWNFSGPLILAPSLLPILQTLKTQLSETLTSSKQTTA